MALVDNKDILANIFALGKAKDSGDSNMHALLKEQYMNSLRSYQLKQSESALKTLQSSYEKTLQANEDLKKQASIYNQTYDILSNPQNPLFEFGTQNPREILEFSQPSGDFAEFAKLANSKDLRQKLIANNPQLASTLRIMGLGEGGADSQKMLTENLLTTPDAQGGYVGSETVRRNIAVPGMKEQREMANSPIGRAEWWVKSFPESMLKDNPTLKRQRALGIAHALGMNEEYAFMIELMTDEQIVQAIKAKAGVPDEIQIDEYNRRTNRQVPFHPPTAPTKPTQINTQRQQSDNIYADVVRKYYPQAKFDYRPDGSLVREYNKDARVMKEYNARIAHEFRVPADKTKTGSGGSGTSANIQKASASLAKIAIAMASNPEKTKGKEREFGTLGLLFALNDMLPVGDQIGVEPEQFARDFIIEIGSAVERMGGTDKDGNPVPTNLQQGFIQLIENKAMLTQLAMAAFAASQKKGGGAVTLQEMGFKDEEITNFAVAAAGTGVDELNAGLKILIPDMDERVKKATTDPLPPSISEPVNPPDSKYKGDKVTSVTTPGRRGIGKTTISAGQPNEKGLRLGMGVILTVPKGIPLNDGTLTTKETTVSNYKIIRMPTKEEPRYRIAPVNTKPDWRGQYVNENGDNVERFADPSIISPNSDYKEGDTVGLFFPDLSKTLSSKVAIIKLGPAKDCTNSR